MNANGREYTKKTVLLFAFMRGKSLWLIRLNRTRAGCAVTLTEA